MNHHENDPGLFEIMYSCRAMRRLDTREVPEELLVRLVDAANQGPSGSNMQGARWIIVRDDEQKKRLAELNKIAVERYIGPMSARPEELPHQSAAKRKRMADAVLWQADHLHEVPALIIACLEFREPVAELVAARGGGSIWPNVQNLLLTARALGLGAAPTTLGLADRDKSRSILGLPDNVEAYCLIPVGWPNGNFGPVTRLPARETIRWDRY